MKKRFALTFLILLAINLFIHQTVSAGNTDFPPGDDGARSLLMKFLYPSTDGAGLTMSLRPDPEDYKAYFVGPAAERAMAGYEAVWRGDPVIAPNPGQTELLLFKATTDELIAGAPAAQNFPGGYSRIHEKLAPGHTVYRFKFVKPGESHGMAFDGLVHINGGWVIFPKPWRVFR